MSRLRAWLDASPIASIALELMRDATGRRDPLEPLRPTRPAALPAGAFVGFWSLVAGVGASTLAALTAHRSAAGGRAPLLVDLDRWAPSLALRASLEAMTISDALLRPGREPEAVSRWAEVPFLPGAPSLHAIWEGGRVRGSIERAAGVRACVLDLGSGADALDREILTRLDRLVVVTGTRAGQLQAAFCSVELLRDVRCGVGVAVVGASEEDAVVVAKRLPWPLLVAIPQDGYLAADEFAARAPTLVAVDRLIRALA